MKDIVVVWLEQSGAPAGGSLEVTNSGQSSAVLDVEEGDLACLAWAVSSAEDTLLAESTIKNVLDVAGGVMDVELVVAPGEGTFDDTNETLAALKAVDSHFTVVALAECAWSFEVHEVEEIHVTIGHGNEHLEWSVFSSHDLVEHHVALFVTTENTEWCGVHTC